MKALLLFVQYIYPSRHINERSILKIGYPLRRGNWNRKSKYMVLAKFQAMRQQTSRVDQLEMEEVTFERHQRLPSRWRYSINNSTLKKSALSKKIYF